MDNLPSKSIEKMNYAFLPVLLFILTLFFEQTCSVTLAQGDSDSAETYSTAYVNLDGHNLFRVRGITSYPAEERANAISERIEVIAKDYSLSPGVIIAVSKEDHDELLLNDLLIMRVLDSDARVEGVSRETFSMGVKSRVAKAIYSYRYERSYDSLLRNLLYSLIAITLCVILLIIIRFVARRINTFLEMRLKRRFEALESRSFQLIRSNQIWITISGLVKTLKFILILLIIFFTVQYLLGLFPWTRFISISLLDLFIRPFGDFGIALVNFIPSLAFLIAIFFITKYLLKLVKLFFHGIEHRNIAIAGFDPEWALMTYKITRLFLIAFAVIVAYPYIPGSDSAAFKGVSLFLGILFSLGSTSVISNLIAGYTMTYRKTYRIGDIVEIDGSIGRVVEMKLFVTRLHTSKNEEVVIPNSVVLSNKVINYSTLAPEKGLILHTTVGIGYETPWRQVEGMLMLAAEHTEGVLKEPNPFVLQKSLGDFAVTYELNVYTKDPVNRLKIYSNLHQNILDIFNENNIQIMTPAYEGDPEEPKVVPKEKWFAPVTGKNDQPREKIGE